MDDRALIRSFEGVHDRRLVAFAVVLGGVVAGFRANHVERGADAMALVRPPPARIMAAPPASPAK